MTHERQLVPTSWIKSWLRASGWEFVRTVQPPAREDDKRRPRRQATTRRIELPELGG